MKKTLIIIAVLFMSLLSVDRLIWSPLWGAWRRMDDTVLERRLQLAEDRQLLADHEKINKEYSALASGHAAGMLLEIETLARRSGLYVKDLEPQGALVRVAAESSWNNLARFVYDVQRSPQLLSIEKAGISRKGNEEAILIGQFVIGETRRKE